MVQVVIKRIPKSYDLSTDWDGFWPHVQLDQYVPLNARPAPDVLVFIQNLQRPHLQ